MSDDTPTTKAPAAEPTPSAEPTPAADDDAAAPAGVAVGRPTPSPDQLLLPPLTASSSPSDAGSPLASAEVEIGGRPVDGTPGSEGRDDDDDDDDDAAYDAAYDASFAAAILQSTPSPLTKSVAALAALSSGASKSSPEDDARLPPLGPVSTPAVGASPAAPPAAPLSGFGRDGILPGSMVKTPDLASLPLAEAARFDPADFAASDFEALGREVVAAAATASAMLSRGDGFDAGALLPLQHPGTMFGSHAALASNAAAHTPGGSVDLRQFGQFPRRDAYPLPSYMQTHLDETYAASTVVVPHRTDADTFFQVTAFRPRNASSAAAAAGGGALRPISELRGKTMEQLVAQRPVSASTRRRNVQTRPRPLPLRKRKLEVYPDSDDEEEYVPPPREEGTTTKKKRKTGGVTLIRHSMKRKDDGERTACRCAKSKCLKLYCDCFQQKKMCDESLCSCKGCKNTPAYGGPDGVRTKKIEAILARRPDAFEPRTKETEDGCRCKKNKCLKKYCVCFGAGLSCGDNCRCLNCGNLPEEEEEGEEEKEELSEVSHEVKVEAVSSRPEMSPKVYKTVDYEESGEEFPEYAFAVAESPPPLPLVEQV